MGKTKIEWTRGDDGSEGATWNPVTGCTKVSPGCAHCYAERQTERFHGPGSFDKITLHPERLDQPLHWKKPRRVFVNSMSDLFHEDISDEFIAHVFAVMVQCPQCTFQILTKRPSRMLAWFHWDEGDIDVEDLVGGALHDCYGITASGDQACGPDFFYFPWPLPNVWLGVSVENQHFADERIPLLLQTPAAVRFISAEPLLGPITLCETGQPEINVNWLRGEDGTDPPIPALNWVICGGESGPGARQMDLAWARFLRDQCKTVGVAFFMKQITERGIKIPFENWPEDLKVREFPE